VCHFSFYGIISTQRDDLGRAIIALKESLGTCPTTTVDEVTEHVDDRFLNNNLCAHDWFRIPTEWQKFIGLLLHQAEIEFISRVLSWSIVLSGESMRVPEKSVQVNVVRLAARDSNAAW
jgi:hypothetical protein